MRSLSLKLIPPIHNSFLRQVQYFANDYCIKSSKKLSTYFCVKIGHDGYIILWNLTYGKIVKKFYNSVSGNWLILSCFTLRNSETEIILKFARKKFPTEIKFDRKISNLIRNFFTLVRLLLLVKSLKR